MLEWAKLQVHGACPRTLGALMERLLSTTAAETLFELAGNGNDGSVVAELAEGVCRDVVRARGRPHSAGRATLAGWGADRTAGGGGGRGNVVHVGAGSNTCRARPSPRGLTAATGS
jgi:hypothetical protein